MPLKKLIPQFSHHLETLKKNGSAKGAEKIVVGRRPAGNGFGERFLLHGFGEREFLRMNSNAYLGLGLHPKVIAAETQMVEEFGAGPGAVRFISGTYASHTKLESALADFHGRDAAMILSAAYATVIGVLPQIITADTLVISDALNHNSIINAIRLAQPAAKAVYPHLDLKTLEATLKSSNQKYKRVCVVTDGVFSMRGDHAPLNQIASLCMHYEDQYEEGIVTIVDDSHGVGAFGARGRGTEEITGGRADILIGTLGKAFGVNGGYVVADTTTIEYLRETTPLYIYSNPISPAEAAAAMASVQIVDADEGKKRLAALRRLGQKLRQGLSALGYETIMGEHPIIPIMVRDSEKTSALVEHLFQNNILVTGLNYPVVPKGDEELRLQMTANHTDADVEYFLDTLKAFVET